jgi:acetylornithine/succinyldiaminopimelate/putrescine aminotransferase
MHTYHHDYMWYVEPNSVQELEATFAKAKKENVYIEGMFMESVMGEGNPGEAMTPAFYDAARKLCNEHDSFLLVDNIQAGLRTTGNLSIVDYPGFEQSKCPDFEVYSKAVNAGQFPVSVLALNKRSEAFYKHGVYGNTMTGNARACHVACTVLSTITDDVRKNIVDMGKYAVAEYKKLMAKHPKVITAVSGTGLLYAVQLNKQHHTVVSMTGAEMHLRYNGIGVIHGGENALRFTPHFHITKEEIDMQVDFVRALVEKIDYQTLGPAAQARL